MHEPPPPGVHDPLEQSDLPRDRAIISLWLGLLGMVMYMFALKWAIYDSKPWNELTSHEVNPSPSYPPLLASLGCVLFIVAVVVSWRVRLSRLLLMAVVSGLLVWAVVCVQENHTWQ